MRVENIEKYYTCIDNLLTEFDQKSRKYGFKAENLPEYEEWKLNTRAKLKEISGLDNMRFCELSPVLLETEQLDGYRRDKLIIQTEPDVWMPMYVLIPDGVRDGEKRPCIIAAHGHDGAGKYSTAGRSEIPAVKEINAHYHYDYGLKFAKEGCITFCPDARGFGERREYERQGNEDDRFINGSCSFISRRALCMGKTLIGMWTWDLMRLIDYIQTRSDCDAGRLGCAGLSGGGLQCLWLAALDDRIKCAVISGNFFGFKDSILRNIRCDCSYVPNLCEYVDAGDFGALICPHPLLIESGTKDLLSGYRGIDNVIPQVNIAQRAYRLFNAEEKLFHYIFEGRHMWDGKVAYDFVKKWL